LANWFWAVQVLFKELVFQRFAFLWRFLRDLIDLLRRQYMWSILRRLENGKHPGEVAASIQKNKYKNKT
jgi:hypothetical protein